MRDDPAGSAAQAPAATPGVTVTNLATVDLGREIEGMAGWRLRMRMVTMEPGAVFGPIHDHRGRPGTVYVLEGTITDHRDDGTTEYGPGPGWPEDRTTLHWLENRGRCRRSRSPWTSCGRADRRRRPAAPGGARRPASAGRPRPYPSGQGVSAGGRRAWA